MSNHPPVGSRAEVTFTGIVDETTVDEDGCTLTFAETAAYMSWDPAHPPQIRVLDPGWKLGDAAWYTHPDGSRYLIFRMQYGTDVVAMWRTARGMALSIPDSHADRVEIIARSTMFQS